MPDRPTSEPKPPAARPGHAAPHPDDTRARVLLAMLHGARDRGDRPAAEHAWKRIVLAELERVRGIVGGYRHHALPGGRIPAADVDDVAHDVFLRLHDKAGTLEGRSVGELRAFMRTATTFACLDYMRAYVREDERRAGSLDAAADESAGRRPSDDALARLAAELTADGAESEIARTTIHQGLALVDDDKRAVLIMDEAGYKTPEIMERLGLSRDVVYQRRHRGLAQLAEAVRELSGEDAGG